MASKIADWPILASTLPVDDMRAVLQVAALAIADREAWKAYGYVEADDEVSADAYEAVQSAASEASRLLNDAVDDLVDRRPDIGAIVAAVAERIKT